MHKRNVNFVTVGFLKILDLNQKNDNLTIAYSLKDIAILNVKEATFRCILMGISKNEGLKD